MKHAKFGMAVVGLALFGVGGVGLAAERNDLGKTEYVSHCAICHGAQGKGDGPYRSLIPGIPDLTVLAKKNNGVYPFAMVYEMIDGTQAPKAHGTADMPIWGTVYKDTATELAKEYPEAFVRARILALDEYIYRLQVK